MITYTGLEYLKIDIANARGLDKLSFSKRIAWVNNIEASDDVMLEEYAEHADDPYLYMGAVMAFRKAQQGLPTGHVVALDACASGVSIMSTVMGCKLGCKNTGMIGETRQDFYSNVTGTMNNILDGSSVTIDRDDAKKASMCFFYGSKAEPKNVFGDGTEELSAFFVAQEACAPGAMVLMDELLGSWQPYTLNHSWTLPDGFEVIAPVLQKKESKIEIDELDHASIQYRYEVNEGTEQGLSTAANTIHSIDGFVVRELCRRCNYDRSKLLTTKNLLEIGCPEIACKRPKIERLAKEHKFISLVGIEHVTAKNLHKFSAGYKMELLELIESILERPSFEVLTIHDSFSSHPNYLNYVRQTYVEIFAELAESNIMEEIIKQIRNDPDYRLEKLSDDLGDLIRESEYTLS